MQLIGIDPGDTSGGLAFIDTTWEPTSGDDSPLMVIKMPATEHDVADLLQGVGRPRFAFLERVGAMPKQGLSSTFKFGSSYGFLRGVLVGLGIPHELVTPQVWQKVLGCRTGGDKNVSKAAAQRLWPQTKFTHATADAALIAEYGRRTLLARGML